MRYTPILEGPANSFYLRQLEAFRSKLANEELWFQNGSRDITVKRIPDEIYKVIKREAKE